MAYRLVQPHPDDVQEQLEALPASVRADFDDAVETILVLPWESRALNHVKPTVLRVQPFTDGFEAVQIERVQWIG